MLPPPSAALVLTLAAAGHAASTAAQSQPVFRSGVELVTIDVTVVDDRGRPIGGLGPGEFQVKVDGRPRRVAWAEFVPHRDSTETAPRAAHFTSNQEISPGRLILVAVDQMHIRRVEGLAALRAAGAFIDALDPADRVAAAPISHMGPIQFTDQHVAVKRYLETLAGTASSMPVQFNLGLTEALAISEGNRSWLDRAVLRECGESLGRLEDPRRAATNQGMRDPCPNQVEQESRGIAQEARTNARQSLASLMRLIARLADIDGPKTLVFVSEGLVAEPQLIDLTSLGAAAQAARVSIYVLQLETPLFDAAESKVSPTLEADIQTRVDGLARLAGSARGGLFRLVGADPYPFRRVLQEISGYYLVAFEVENVDRDGRTHRLDVAATAPGATIRARPAFRLTGAPSKDAVQTEIVKLLRNPRVITELPLRVAAYTFDDERPELRRVLLALEAETTAGAGAATIGFVLVNGSGVIAASGTGAAEGGRLVQAVSVPAGRYVIRAAAVDASGRQGSVERRFDAVLHGSDAVRFSDLMLSDEETGRPLRPAIAARGTRRIAAVFEIYAAPDWKPSEDAATVEVARDGETALVTAPGALTPAGNGRWRVRAELAVGELAPGTYHVRARVTAPGGVQRLESAFVR